MLSTDRDVVLRSFESPNVSREVALIAYANFAVEKYGWIAHVTRREGEAPPLDRVNSRVAGFHDTVLTALKITVAAYM